MATRPPLGHLFSCSRFLFAVTSRSQGHSCSWASTSPPAALSQAVGALSSKLYQPRNVNQIILNEITFFFNHRVNQRGKEDLL